MAKLSNASSTDNLLTNDHLELENQQCTCESPNHDNEGTINVSTANQHTKPISVRCTGERVMIAAMFIAILSLAVVIMALSIYVGELHRRVDRIEMVSNSVDTSSTINKTQFNSSLDIGDGDLSDLSTELEGVKGSVSILENMLSELNSSLSNSLLFFTNETASNNIMFSSLQRSLELIEGDLGLAKFQLQNLSSLYINHLGDYDATVYDIYTTRAITEQNMSQLYDVISQVERNHSLNMLQLYDLIHQMESNHSVNMLQLKNLIRRVESNHSFIIGEFSRILDEAALNMSVLAQMINNTFNLVGSQDQIISGIRSNVSSIESSLTALRGMLTAKVQHFDDQVGRIQRSLSNQWQRLNRFDDRLDDIELQLLRFSKDEAVHIVPFGFFLLSVVSFLVSYIIL